MQQEERALKLIERIYESVIEPDSWNTFLAELSEALGGAAIQLTMRLPDDPLNAADPFFRFGLDPSFQPTFVKLAVQGLPWNEAGDDLFRGRFGSAREIVGEEQLEESTFYREYMQPQGLAPDWPICHLISREEGLPLAGVSIYRREGGRAIEPEDLALLDLLVPHLGRAYAIHAQLAGSRQEHRALTEVIDRLPVGVFLADAQGHPVLQNRSAEKIIALADGFGLERGRLWIESARENQTLQTLIAAASTRRVARGESAGQVMTVPRPSGRRAFPVLVGPLLAASPGTIAGEARVIVFIADPEGGQISTTEVLETLYQLTHAEAELVRLVSEGRSLDEIAIERGVTMNTIRSQLKQVFSKTDTKRQGELVHLVLTGVASFDAAGSRRSD